MTYQESICGDDLICAGCDCVLPKGSKCFYCVTPDLHFLCESCNASGGAALVQKITAAKQAAEQARLAALDADEAKRRAAEKPASKPASLPKL